MSHPQCQTVIETNIELETALEKVLNFNTLCDFTSSILDFEGETSLNIQAFKENNTVVISYASKYNVERISLLSLYGQVIKEWAIHDNSASIYLRDELPAGLYFVRAKTESQEIVKSFIKH